MNLRIDRITTEKAFDEIEVEWNELAEASAGTVFQSHVWNRAWWRHFGKGNRLHILLFRDGDRAVGIAPLFLDSIRIGRFRLRDRLRWIGSDASRPADGFTLGLIPYTDYLDLIIRPGYEMEVCSGLSVLFHSLLPQLDEIALEALPESGSAFRHLIPELENAGLHFEESPGEPARQVELPGNWEEFLRSLKKNRRSQARRAVKRAEKGDEQRFVIQETGDPSQVAAAFELLVRMHQDKWAGYGSLGTFGEQRNLAFHREIAFRLAERGEIRVRSALPVEDSGRPVAIDLNLHHKDRLYGLHCAVDECSPYYRSGPGTILLYSTLKGAADQGIETYDFLRGAEPYKDVMANRRSVNRQIVIRNRGVARRLRLLLTDRIVWITKRLLRERACYELLSREKPARERLSLIRGRLGAMISGRWRKIVRRAEPCEAH